MKTVWKFAIQLTHKQVVSMPEGAEILTAQFQGPFNLCLWALVDDAVAMERRLIEVIGTGHDIADAGRRYIATAQQPNMPLVWHVFEGVETD